MKKAILKTTILLSIFAFIASSCDKKDNELAPKLDGKYKVSMDGEVVAEGETEEVGMMGNAISLSLGQDFGILISGVPESVGGEVQFDANNTDVTVTISGENLLRSGDYEMYFSISGKVKRSTASKITFEGTCSEMGSSTVHTFSGTAESDAYKII